MPIEEVKSYNITGVEVFAVGKWNNIEHKHEALESMVRAFNALRPGWIPALKLGHDDKQKVAKQSGIPAVGWVKNLYVRGDKLFADFENIPEKVFQAIKQKMYRKVSCEVYYGVELGTEKYTHVLSAVALLGAELPGVMNLNDILGQFQFLNMPEVFAKPENQATLMSYSQTFEYEEEEAMPELQEQLDAQTAELQKLQGEKAEFAAKAEADAKELEALRKFKAEAEADKLKLELEAKEAKKTAFITSLESKKLLTPATKDLVAELLSDKQEFSIGDKKMNKEELVEQLVTLTAEAGKVNFEENSLQENPTDKNATDAKKADIEKHMAEHKCDFATAYKAVMKK